MLIGSIRLAKKIRFRLKKVCLFREELIVSVKGRFGLSFICAKNKNSG